MRATVILILLIASAALAPAATSAQRAEPRILTVKPLDAPVAGRAIRIEITVKDPLAAINGVQVDFGDGLGSTKHSACRAGASAMAPFTPGTAATFTVAHAYLLPGEYDLQVAATSGDCVLGPLTAKRKLRVKVRAPRPGDALRPVATAAQTDGCAGANTLPVAATLTAAWRATLCLANAVRVNQGLGKLRSNRRLRLAATAHARDMVARGYFAHESPAGVDLVTRLRRARYRGGEAAENIGAASDSLATPMAMLITWMESPPHRANLLERRFDEAGSGVAAGFPTGGAGATYVLDFGRRPR